ncbi:MAG: hypothetical protein ACFE9C_14195 [Candidatus Hodarchaeota archaeon]
MQKYNKFIGIGLAIIIFIIPYSILLYIYLENTIPGGGFHLTMAQTAFVYNLIYIVPVGIVGIILIYKGNKLRKA